MAVLFPPSTSGPPPRARRRRRGRPAAGGLAVLLLTVVLAGCPQTFEPTSRRKFPTDEILYRATMAEYQAGRWDNALAGFEQLTLRLAARDTLFPSVLYNQGKAHAKKHEFLLAAQSFTRLAESFPNDELADDALLEAGKAYGAMWRKPELDAAYGESAMSTLRTMMALYPNSTLIPEAQKELDRLTEWFAEKSYENGMHYFRRKAYESGLIYFGDILQRFPTTHAAKDALLRMAESYKAIKYTPQYREACDSLRATYPAEPRVREVCAAAPRTAPPAPAAPAAVPPTAPPPPETRPPRR